MSVSGHESTNLYHESDHRWVPGYEVYDDKLIIHDPVWGDCEIGQEPGDEVLLNMLDNSLVRRTMAIEQLSLDPLTATIPSTTGFSRWEHVWGSVAFVRKMTEDTDMTSRDRLNLQLRTFVSDLGHTAYSHQGDWLFQGMGGPENQHDNELKHLLEVSGIADVLRHHDIQPEEVVANDHEDWIERPSPDLCVDRVDYGAREMQRWLNLDMSMWGMLRPESFILDPSGQLVVADHERALRFAKAYLLLSSEHWSEPVHRLQELFQQHMTKHILADSSTDLIVTLSEGLEGYHPRDLLYTVDADITREMQFIDTFLNTLRPLSEAIGLAKRRTFEWERKDQLASFLRNDTDTFPRPLEHYSDYGQRLGKVSLLPSNLIVTPVAEQADVSDFGENTYSVDFFLAPFKARQVDPLFYDDSGQVQRLSEADANYRSLAEQQARITRQAYVARLLVNSEVKLVIEEGIQEAQASWEAAIQRPRMGSERFLRLLHEAENMAAGYRFINMHWYR
jgi:hypothetical protein